MASIYANTIGTNAYAPEGANDINLYYFNGQYDMTLPQLVMAICFRLSACIESQSVIVMNKINESAVWLETLAVLGEDILERRDMTAQFDTSRTGYTPTKLGDKSCTYKNFLMYEVGLTADEVPDYLTSIDAQTLLYSKLEDPINSATTNNQEQTIELQSCLSRRDSTFNTSASTIKKLGSTMSANAANF